MNAGPHSLPLLSRDASTSLARPSVPLNFVNPGLSPPQVFSIFKGYWKLSTFILFSVLAATAIIMTLLPRTYTAVVTLMVNYEVNDPLNGKELPVGQLGSYIATQMELMQTREVLFEVVDRLKLTENKNYARGYEGGSGTLQEWVATKLKKDLTIFQGQQGNQLIYINFSANDPKEAALIANTVAEVYKEQDHTRSTGPPGDRAKYYEQQLEELKAKVDQAQQQVTAFHQLNGLVDEGNKTNVDMVLLANLEGRLAEAQNARRTAEARATGTKSMNDQVLSSSLVQTLKTQLATQKAKLAQLQTMYTSRHPEIVELKSQIAANEHSLAAALQSYSTNSSDGLKTAQRLEKDLEQAVTEQRGKVLSNSQLHDQAAKYLLALDSAQAVYKRALEGYDQIRFASSGRTTNISFVSRATPPAKASKPKILTGFALGILAALVLSLGIPLLYELLNRRVRCRDDLERHHGIPVLVEFGALPLRTAA